MRLAHRKQICQNFQISARFAKISGTVPQLLNLANSRVGKNFSVCFEFLGKIGEKLANLLTKTVIFQRLSKTKIYPVQNFEEARSSLRSVGSYPRILVRSRGSGKITFKRRY